MKRHLTLACFLSMALGGLLPESVYAADPYVGYIYPAAIAAGTTNRLVVGGQFFWKEMSAWVSGEGVEVLKVERVPGFPYPGGLQRKYLRKALDALERGEPVPPLPEIPESEIWHSNVWWSALGELDAKSRAIVAEDIWVQKNALQAAPSLKQLLLVTLAVSPDAAPGCRQLRVFRSDAVSAPRPLDILPMPVVEEPLYAPPSRKCAAPQVLDRLPVAAVGQIKPGETDRWNLRLEKGTRFTAQVRGRFYQPYIGDAVPGFFNPVVALKTAEGREVAFADDFNGMDPDPQLSVEIPETGDYVFEVSDRLFRGRADFVYTAKFTTDPLPTLSSATVLPLVKKFEVTEPGEWVFDVKARRLGSPMDPRLTLRAADGTELGRWDDVTNRVQIGTVIQNELDPIVRYRFEKPGRYELSVDDTCGRKGPELRCSIEVRPAHPAFDVFADRSAFFLTPGQRCPFTVSVVRREGFEGPVTLVENEWMSFENARVPAGTNAWRVVAIGKKVECDERMKTCEILAVAEVGEGVIGSKVVAADPFEQAFAWQHLVSYGQFQFFPRKAPQKILNTEAQRRRGSRK